METGQSSAEKTLMVDASQGSKRNLDECRDPSIQAITKMVTKKPKLSEEGFLAEQREHDGRDEEPTVMKKAKRGGDGFSGEQEEQGRKTEKEPKLGFDLNIPLTEEGIPASGSPALNEKGSGQDDPICVSSDDHEKSNQEREDKEEANELTLYVLLQL